MSNGRSRSATWRDLDRHLAPVDLADVLGPRAGKLRSARLVLHDCRGARLEVSADSWPALHAPHGEWGGRHSPDRLKLVWPGGHAGSAWASVTGWKHEYGAAGATASASADLYGGRVVFQTGTRTHTIAVVTHGFGLSDFVVPPTTVGDSMLWAVDRTKLECGVSERCRWLVLGRLGGASLDRRRLIRQVPAFLECLSLAWGERVVGGPLLALDRNGLPIELRFGRTDGHQPSGVYRGWLANEIVEEVRAAVRFMKVAWPRWFAADEAYGIRVAADFLIHANGEASLEHEARALVGALEHMVKVHSGFASGPIKPPLKALEERLGLAAMVGDQEREWFRLYRNQLAHPGTLRVDPRAGGVHQPRTWTVIQSIGWLRSFVLRHVCAALGWSGQMMDFASVPFRPRRVFQRRWRGPRYVPPTP